MPGVLELILHHQMVQAETVSEAAWKELIMGSRAALVFGGT